MHIGSRRAAPHRLCGHLHSPEPGEVFLEKTQTQGEGRVRPALEESASYPGKLPGRL